jgi:N-acetylmuramoyl-L-alanine amidase
MVNLAPERRDSNYKVHFSRVDSQRVALVREVAQRIQTTVQAKLQGNKRGVESARELECLC